VLTTGLLSVLVVANTLPVVPVFSSPPGEFTWYFTFSKAPAGGGDYNYNMSLPKLYHHLSGHGADRDVVDSYAVPSGGGDFWVTGSCKQVWFISSEDYDGHLPAQVWAYQLQLWLDGYRSNAGSCWGNAINQWSACIGYVMASDMKTFIPVTSGDCKNTPGHLFDVKPNHQTITGLGARDVGVGADPKGSYHIVFLLETPYSSQSSIVNGCHSGYVASVKEIPELALIAAPLALLIPLTIQLKRSRNVQRKI
jgi:hypothetical protein